MQTKAKSKDKENDSRKTTTRTEISLTIVAMVMLLQQIPLSQAAYEDDPCETKNTPGICKTWADCPVIKTLIQRNVYTQREVVSCGFGIREELICCPLVADETSTTTTTTTTTLRPPRPNIETTTQRDFWLDDLEQLQKTTTTLTSTTTTTTTQKPDFWLDLITTTTTTQKPDFWLDFITTTTPTTTTTTTTTVKPIVVGDKKLDSSVEYIDLTKLLAEKRENKNKSIDQNSDEAPAKPLEEQVVDQWNVNPGNGPENQHNGNFQNGALVMPQNNGHNGNQGNFPNAPFAFPQNNGQGANWNQGNIGLGQGSRGQGNTGLGQIANFPNANPFLNSPGNRGNRGQGNRGRGPNNNGWTGRSGGQGFSFPDHNNGGVRPNEFNGFPNNPNPGNNWNSPNQFGVAPVPVVNPGFVIEPAIEQGDLVAEGSSPHVVWVAPADHVEIIDPSQIISHHTIPVMESYVMENNLEPQSRPSTTSTQPSASFNPIQKVYENLINSGMDIVKAKAEFIDTMWQKHQQNQRNQNGRSRPMASNQQGGQQSIFGNQNPAIVETPQHPLFPLRPGQQGDSHSLPSTSILGQPTHQVSFPNGQTETNSQLVQFPQHPVQGGSQFPQNPNQQGNSAFVQTGSQGPSERPGTSNQQGNSGFVQLPPNGAQSPNIQTPPAQVLDPFKPFEFRPPPEDEVVFAEDNNSISNLTPDPGPRPNSNDRPAVRACRRIQEGLKPSLSQHILGGIPAELGEFPHMAAIGYGRIGDDDQGPYDILCGGSLIDARFVLTAAHCVASRDRRPSIVRLGVVNFTNPEEMANAVEMRIKQVHIHPEYSQRRTYNDIALLELEQPVAFTELIYPICLYSDIADPKTDIRLWVSGWGTINTATRAFSNILLKAPLFVTPIDKCNASFVDYGLTRQIQDGIIDTQLCAEDKDLIKDACQGDSGGPLVLVVDESLKSYKIVGVVSAGFGCANTTPGLYTRVAAFLDYIEQIVWPNGSV
uniref:Peptidase S1 domain-containing protein n=1 Tax=Musca domestica TaxID=7370 RepID=A0A1I8NHA4_MUSDO